MSKLSDAMDSILTGVPFKEIEKARVEADLKRQRLERFVQFFGRVNSAFTFRKVTVKVEHSPLGAPAWSGASEVTFNSRMIGDLNDARSIASVKGLDLHEISHILYTPREGSEIFEYVRENKFFMAYNCLEDQRIETLFTSKYPSTIEWFTATILIHFVDKPEAFESSYPLLRGRRYLPTELRARSRNAYSNQEDIDELCEIVDTYRTLVFPADTEKGKELVRRFHDLLPKQEVPDDSDNGNSGQGVKVLIKIKDPFGHGERPSEGLETSASSRPIPPKKQEKDRDRSAKLDKEDDADLAELLKSNPSVELELDLDDLDDDSDLNDDSDLGDADDSGDSDSEDESSNKSSGGSGAGDKAGEIVATVINDLLDDLLNDKNVANEINDILRQLGGLPSLTTNNSKEPELASAKGVTPDATTHHASLSFSRELERLKALYEPAWDKYEPQGRLDANRYMRGDDLDTVFDRWNEGRDDATEIECVILLDNSGSMSGFKANNAYRAMYAIKRALDRINANCTVLTFNDDVKTLYRSTDKATSVIRDAGTGGGTVIDSALQRATKILAETEKPVRIFFAITDGEWSGNQDTNHETINRMARAGVLTAFAFIPEENQSVQPLTQETSHHCEIGAIVHNPLDLISMVRSIVKYGVSRRLINN
jgi:Mg-chelatase subunit ChlD